MVQTERLNFRVDRVVARKLEELSKETGMTMSEIVRDLIEKATPEYLTAKKTT